MRLNGVKSMSFNLCPVKDRHMQQVSPDCHTATPRIEQKITLGTWTVRTLNKCEKNVKQEISKLNATL